MSAADAGVRAFRRALAIALALGTVVAGIGALLVPLGAISHLRGMVEQLCVTAAHITSDIAALGLVILAGSALAVAMFSLVASIAMQRRAIRDWSPVDGAERRRVAQAARAAGIRARTAVFHDDRMIACSRGIAAPSIWISNAAVTALDDSELAAVLIHEDHHCARRDPAKRQLLEVLSRSLFAFPIVGEATRTFLRCAEFAADDAASRATSARATATALLRFAGLPSEPALVQFGAATTVGERVHRLLHSPPERTTVNRRALGISTATAALAALCLTAIELLPPM